MVSLRMDVSVVSLFMEATGTNRFLDLRILLSNDRTIEYYHYWTKSLSSTVTSFFSIIHVEIEGRKTWVLSFDNGKSYQN